MRHSPDIWEFFVEGGDDEASHALLHITEPSTPEEEQKGYFFALAETTGADTEYIAELQGAIDEIESAYYSGGSAEGTDTFEQALESVNRRSHRLTDEHAIQLHCAVGIIRGSDIFLSSHGTPEAWLFYQKKTGMGHMRVIEEDNAPSNQLFSAIMQGSMGGSDFLVLMTPGVPAHFSPDRTEKIILSRGAQDAALHIEKVLEDIRSGQSFAGIIINNAKKDARQTPRQQETKASQDSVVRMVATEETTHEVLSPSVFGDTKKKIQSLFSQETGGEEKNTASEETNYRPRAAERAIGATLNTLLISLGRAIVIGTVGMIHAIKNIAIGIIRAILGLWVLVTNHRNKRHEMIMEWKRSIERARSTFRSLPPITMWLGIAATLFIIVCIGSLAYAHMEKAGRAKAEAYRAQTQAIAAKKEEADARMIYHDETQAFALLREATVLLSDLPKNSAEEKKTADDFAAAIEESKKKIRKMTEISPTPIIDLSAIRTDAQAEKLALFDTTLIAYGPKDPFIYRIHTATGKGDAKNHETIPMLSAASVPKERDRVLFVSGKNALAAYDKDTLAIKPLDIQFPNNDAAIADIFVYNQRLYTLDASGGHIYKHGKTTTGYDAGVVWEKPAGHDALKNPVSLAIDGDMYVLLEDKVIQLASGAPKPFTIANLDPALDHPTALWTYADVNNLYILEPSGKRVIVLDKTGKLIAQYTSSLWRHPTGMAVNEAKKTIYILDGTVIYSFTI